MFGALSAYDDRSMPKVADPHLPSALAPESDDRKRSYRNSIKLLLIIIPVAGWHGTSTSTCVTNDGYTDPNT